MTPVVLGPDAVAELEIVGDADDATHVEVERFLYREARLMDEHRYEDWERLWTDDGVYWVPAFHDSYDPNLRVSIIYDTRAGIAARVQRLAGHHAYAQHPRTRLVRTVSNIVVDECATGELLAHSTFVCSAQRREVVDVWSGRSTHLLRRAAPREAERPRFAIACKRVQLIPLEIPLGNLSFLL